MPPTAPTTMKDVVGYQAEFGDYKKVVLVGSDLMALANAIKYPLYQLYSGGVL